MDKRTLHHFWRYFREIKPMYFLVAAVVTGLICIFALKSNNEHMGELRTAVFQADQKGQGVDEALQNLRNYVVSHMNTQLAAGPNAVHPPIQLKYTYQRLVLAQNNHVQSTNSNLYSDAQHYCEATIPTGFSGRYRESCINNYVSTHGAKPVSVPKNLYEFDFVAAKWSPDLAGWSLVLTIFFILCAVTFWAADYLIKRDLKHHE
ncbi:MAG TPA: hypothetical protein VLG47_01310 [Candidatus Saccharimonadales bacterium]|nr:hypothetical protein [Candidatus Saccharimonadales bacterium]